MRYPWNIYFPWYFVADLVIWGSVIGYCAWRLLR